MQASFLNYQTHPVEAANYNGHIPIPTVPSPVGVPVPNIITPSRELISINERINHHDATAAGEKSATAAPGWSLSPEGYQLFPKYSTLKSPQTSTSSAATQNPTTSSVATTPNTSAGSTTRSKRLYLPFTEPHVGNNTIPSPGSAVYAKRRLHTIVPYLLPPPKTQFGTIPDTRPRFGDADILPLDHTEISAVIQNEPINNTKLFVVIGEIFFVGLIFFIPS